MGDKNEKKKKFKWPCLSLGTTKQQNASFPLHMEHRKFISTRKNDVFHLGWCWILNLPQRLFNVSACIEAGLYNSKSAIIKVYREGSCHKWFYMTVIGKIIRDSEGGWMGKIKVDTIFFLVLWNQLTNVNYFSGQTNSNYFWC